MGQLLDEMKRLQEKSSATNGIVIGFLALQAVHAPIGLVSHRTKIAENVQALNTEPFCCLLSCAQELYHQVLDGYKNSTKIWI